VGANTTNDGSGRRLRHRTGRKYGDQNPSAITYHKVPSGTAQHSCGIGIVAFPGHPRPLVPPAQLPRHRRRPRKSSEVL